MLQTLEKIRNEQWAAQLGVDRLEVSTDRWVSHKPDETATASSWSMFSGSSFHKQGFWCPRIDWWVGGKHYAGLVPIKLREERKRGLMWETKQWVEDEHRMIEAMGAMIRQTVQ